MASPRTDKYRSFLYDESEKDTKWRVGEPPNYDVVNKLFEEDRTKIWPPGSLEEKVQNLLKTWEMEVVHKVSPDDWKTMVPDKISFSLNGIKPQSLAQLRELGGGYNFFLQTSLPKNLRVYDPTAETFESSLVAFTTTFPRGFAIEILQVYSGPPTIVYKFRHWGYMEGPFKGHTPTGERIQLFGIGIFEVNEEMKIEKVEIFLDRGELLGGLIKGGDASAATSSSSCPFFAGTGDGAGPITGS